MVTALTAAVALPTVSGAAFAADTESSVPNVAVTATRFDRYEYAAGDAAAVTITLHNHGPVDAVGVKIVEGGTGESDELKVKDWGGVDWSDKGVTVPAGKTVYVRIQGVVPSGAVNSGRVTFLYGFGADNGDSDESNNRALAGASVPGGKGIMTGASYYDRDHNGQRDPGEGLQYVRVTLVGLRDIERIATAVTGADGEFSIADLPAGEYEIRVRAPEGWWLVRGGTVSHAGVRANETSRVTFEVEPKF
ncbi:hypothetical protein ALI144C_03595 [Actinosynnema sp. ALI-1.44]|nr:hypothetical protein ALI144C_03595 [Actinosynnema sp. ALI-1.44]